MAGLDSVRTNLKNIYDGAKMLVATEISLNETFEAEASRLNQQEEVHRLKSLRTNILEYLERTRDLESVARYAQTKADAVI
jgi:tRNA(Ser,Leu) C12 N-acetylase TAN1